MSRGTLIIHLLSIDGNGFNCLSFFKSKSGSHECGAQWTCSGAPGSPRPNCLVGRAIPPLPPPPSTAVETQAPWGPAAGKWGSRQGPHFLMTPLSVAVAVLNQCTRSFPLRENVASCSFQPPDTFP